METKIILYDHQRLYLDCMTYFLNHNNATKNYRIEVFDDLENIGNYILDENTILILNSSGLNYLDLLNHVEIFLQLNPNLKIIINTMNTEVRTIKRFFDKGVKGYLGSNTNSEEFVEAIKQVSGGKVFVNNNVKNLLLNSIYGTEEENERKFSNLEDLTAREKDVLLLICDGLRSKEIAEKLFISTHTVESHRRNMMLKFNLNSSSKLVKFAMENKLVEY